MQSTDSISRVESLAVGEFIEDFVKQNRPVVVTKGLASWDLNKWTPDYFQRELGDEKVQVFNDYFDFKALMPLSRYFERYFNRPDGSGPVPYVRWYSKLRDVDFPWADAVFDRLRANWQTPSFVPLTDYALPYAPAPQRLDPVEHRFPARGVFMSGKGGRTGLHVDPWQSDAILCGAYGTKAWVMYEPSQAPFLKHGTETVDLEKPDLAKFPEFSKAVPRYTFDLQAGETVYVPRGWFHQVRNVTDSISVTWNFVHAATAGPLREWSQGTLSEIDTGVMKFFVGEHFRKILRPN